MKSIRSQNMGAVRAIMIVLIDWWISEYQVKDLISDYLSTKSPIYFMEKVASRIGKVVLDENPGFYGNFLGDIESNKVTKHMFGRIQDVMMNDDISREFNDIFRGEAGQIVVDSGWFEKNKKAIHQKRQDIKNKKIVHRILAR